jgi:hypothetical protein
MRSRAALALLLAAPQLAPAEVIVAAGVGPSIPSGAGELVRPGAGLTLAFGLPAPAPHVLGLKLRRFHYGGVTRAQTSALAFWRLEGAGAVAPVLAIEAGPALFTGCVDSGACNAPGLAVGVEFGLAAALSDHLRLLATVEPLVQLGMPAGAGALFMPSLTLGVAVR